MTAEGTILIVEDDATTRHFLTEVLEKAGYATVAVADGAKALERLAEGRFALMLLDVWMPGMSGLELLARLRDWPERPRVVVTTSDDAPETVLAAVREQAYQYLPKPIDPKTLVDLVERALSAPPPSPIRVLSAKPHWVELAVPCERDAAERIQSFMMGLKADLDEEIREAVGRVFRELLLNAIEWGGGLDPAREVRISYLRARRMLLYRIADPGPGFSFDDLPHAAVANPQEEPCRHIVVREQKGLRPGGFGILMAQAMIDELLYNEKQNEVVFVKYLDEPRADAPTDA